MEGLGSGGTPGQMGGYIVPVARADMHNGDEGWEIDLPDGNLRSPLLLRAGPVVQV